LVVGCWLLVVGCWLLVVGCWLLVVGCLGLNMYLSTWGSPGGCLRQGLRICLNKQKMLCEFRTSYDLITKKETIP